MSKAPQSAADPRPNDEPYYIDSQCPDCGEDLVLNDELVDSSEIWHDEWACPECDDGIHLDVPESEREAIEGEA